MAGAREQPFGVKSGRRQRRQCSFRVVHFLWFDPHVMKGGVDVFFQHALHLGRDRSPHQIEGIDGKERIPGVGLDLEAFHEAIGLDRLEFALVLDAGERLGGRPVVGGLENAAKQDRDVFEFGPDPLFDRRDGLVAQEGVGTAEIEHELRRGDAHDGLPGRFLYPSIVA